ncbi:hypothetical protein QBC32DRAFT_251000 [Pseudoneurospora amorphoporcata]|uniref:Uncharacterized protein n=1 Tax=Pseudoneurospora amorphoporcata TaxID=241081 RepID=A0AAN6P5W5_9PEZI|nr:hypothetical protein QBC32DRAFT_251000 [Pseudoneurospora amorphoporcata]
MDGSSGYSDGLGPAINNAHVNLPFYNKYAERHREAKQTKHKSHLRFRFGKVLITDGVTPTGRQIATILNKKGHYQIHALYPPGYFPKSVPLAHRRRLIYPVDKTHFLTPVSKHRSYLTWYHAVVEICLEHKIHYIIPQHDTMAVFAAHIKELKRQDVYVHTPRLTSIHSIVDKLAMYRMLRDLNVWHHPWVFLGKETNTQDKIMQIAGYIKESGNYPVMLTDRTEGSDSVYVRIGSKKELEDYILEGERKNATEFLHQAQGIFNNGKLGKWHAWTLLPVQQEITSHFRKTSSYDQRTGLVLRRIGMHLKWHGALSVTFWLPISESGAEPRVMRIDMGIREPMNAYYSGVDLIDALLDLSLPEHSGTEWEDGPRWQDPDRAFDMPEPPTEEDAAVDGTGRHEVHAEQDDVEARGEDDDFKPFPLRVMLVPNFNPLTRGPGEHVQTTVYVNSKSASRLSGETTAATSSSDNPTPENRRRIWRTFHTLRAFVGVEGHGGDGDEEADLGPFEAALPNGGRCEWKTGVSTRQFVLEAEQRITESGETSMLKRLTTVLSDRTCQKSKEEHTPYFLNLWTSSRRNVYNMARQVIDLTVKGKPGTLLSRLLRDDWPHPNPRGLRRDQYADIFKTHLWDGPAMPDGPWGLAFPVESYCQAKRFRVHSQKGVPRDHVAYQFFVRQGQAYGTGTLLPLGNVHPRGPGKKNFRTPVYLPPTPFDLICVGETPKTWNSWTFVPDPHRPRDGELIPSHDSPEKKYIAVSENPQMGEMTPGRCFLFRGNKQHVPRWNRPYRYRMGDHLRYLVNDRRRKLPYPPWGFFFVDDTIHPPVSEDDCFRPIIPVACGIPRTDTVYFYHAHDYSRPYMGYFVPADHYEMVQKLPYNFHYPPLLNPIPVSPPTSSLVRHNALGRAGPSPRGRSEPADQSPRLDARRDAKGKGKPTESEQEQDPKHVWVTAEEILGQKTDEPGETSKSDETDE